MSQDEILPDTLTGHTSSLSSDSTDSLPPIWGRLVRRKVFVLSIELRKDTYIFGRNESCDIYIDSSRLAPQILRLTSKEHFIITRDYTLMPYIKDISKNGTYLNGVLIGKDNSIALADGDLISVGHRIHEVYQYRDEYTTSVSEDFDKKYKITRLLGKGAFGEVYLAIAKGTCSRFAVKCIEISDKDKVKIENEIKILNCLNHPCVIKMVEAIYGRRGHVYILLEFMEGGDLQNRVLKHRRLPEFTAKFFVYQIALAVQYLHSCGITHRDLKPENVLLATKSQHTLVKVTDFGLSKIVQHSTLMRTLCGTPLYVAPEMLKTDEKIVTYTPLVDVWSLGCITYFTLWGRTPFQKTDEEFEDDEDCLGLRYLFGRIKRGQFVIPSQDICDDLDQISDAAINLVLQMLDLDPKQRINIKDVCDHEWLRDENMMTMTRKLF